MTKLANKQVEELIATAVAAGSRPTIAQLTTLAVALGKTDAYRFLTTASLSDKVAVKNAVAGQVFGKEPAKVSASDGTVLGLPLKDAAIATGENIIGKPEKSEPVDEAQKNIKERRKTEEFHSETSDRKNRVSAVSPALKVKTDPKHETILERGPKEQERREKADDRKPVTAAVKTAAPIDPHGDVDPALNRNFDPSPEAGEGEHDAVGKETTTHEEQEALMMETGEHGKVRGTVVTYANRIKRGENVERVLTELLCGNKPKTAEKIRWAFKDTYADLGVGDTVAVQTESGAANVKIDTIGKDNAGKPTLIGKDNTNQIRVIPSGTQVQTITDPSQLGQSSGQVSQTSQTMAPAAAPAPTGAAPIY